MSDDLNLKIHCAATQQPQAHKLFDRTIVKEGVDVLGWPFQTPGMNQTLQNVTRDVWRVSHLAADHFKS